MWQVTPDYTGCCPQSKINSAWPFKVSEPLIFWVSVSLIQHLAHSNCLINICFNWVKLNVYFRMFPKDMLWFSPINDIFQIAHSVVTLLFLKGPTTYWSLYMSVGFAYLTVKLSLFKHLARRAQNYFHKENHIGSCLLRVSCVISVK